MVKHACVPSFHIDLAIGTEDPARLAETPGPSEDPSEGTELFSIFICHLHIHKVCILL